MNKKLTKLTIIFTITILILVIFGMYREESQLNKKSSTSQSIQKQRDDGVYELSKNFNEYIVLEDKMYGYELFSEQAKSDPRVDTYEDYVSWAKRMKEAYPLLGTTETKIEYGNRDAIDLRIGEFDDGIHFILEVDETDGVYTINEIRSYSSIDKQERKYDGNGCYLISQEKSQKIEDCPLW